MESELNMILNIKDIIDNYFDELMAVHSVIYKSNLQSIDIKPDQSSLTVELHFQNGDDCNSIYKLTNNIIVHKYGVNLSIRSIMTSETSIYMIIIKI